MLLILNIGLNNNPSSVQSVENICKEVFGITKTQTKQVISTYNGEEEPTLVVQVPLSWNINVVEHVVEKLCEEFTQECIAMVYGGVKKLIFNPLYSGERFEFASEFFVEM